MAIKSTDVNDEYPYLFLVSQTIYQRIPASAGDPSEYFLTMLLTYYKIENDLFVFDPSRQLTIDIDDFTTETLIAMGNGDMEYADALAAQQIAIAKLATEKTDAVYEVV